MTKKIEYGVLRQDGEILEGFSKEEAYSYMECESGPQDRLIVRLEGEPWHYTDGNEVNIQG